MHISQIEETNSWLRKPKINVVILFLADKEGWPARKNLKFEKNVLPFQLTRFFFLFGPKFEF